jgi:hypothetical protein
MKADGETRLRRIGIYRQSGCGVAELVRLEEEEVGLAECGSDGLERYGVARCGKGESDEGSRGASLQPSRLCAMSALMPTNCWAAANLGECMQAGKQDRAPRGRAEEGGALDDAALGEMSEAENTGRSSSRRDAPIGRWRRLIGYARPEQPAVALPRLLFQATGRSQMPIALPETLGELATSHGNRRRWWAWGRHGDTIRRDGIGSLR